MIIHFFNDCLIKATAIIVKDLAFNTFMIILADIQPLFPDPTSFLPFQFNE